MYLASRHVLRDRGHGGGEADHNPAKSFKRAYARFVIGPRVELFREPRQAVEVHVTQVTQSAPITCAQIATILKNSASEASVANSSTMVRHMSLTPTSVQEFNVFPCFGLTLEGSRFIGRAGNGNVQLRAEH